MLDYGWGTGLVSLPLRDKVKLLTIMDSSEQMTLQVEAKIKQKWRMFRQKLIS